jgi:NAD-dependent deacetylase
VQFAGSAGTKVPAYVQFVGRIVRCSGWRSTTRILARVQNGCMSSPDRLLDDLIERIRSAPRLTLLTGAGVSAASGVPTFRGADGLWRQYRATDLATPDAFARDPRLVWEWYGWRRERVAACRPNRAHEVIAAWTMRNPHCHLVTQNVDDLHVRAASQLGSTQGSERLIRLHGSIWELSCWKRCATSPRSWRDERIVLAAEATGEGGTLQELPTCPACGGLARPAVVWFGESLDPRDVEAALDATACDVYLTVGTSAVVYPAAGFLHAARQHGAFTGEINLEETPASSSVDVAIRAPAEEALDAIEAAL